MRRRRGLIAIWVFVTLLVPACTSATGESDTRAPPAVPGSATTMTSGGPGDHQSLLDQHREQYGSLGGLALVRDGDQEWGGGSGVADRQGTEIDRTTRFRVGSITKAIVAALVLDAVAKGELSLDEAVSHLIPGVLRDDPTVTVRMLLDHTSGVFDQINEGRIADIDQLPDQALRAEARSLTRSYADGEPVVAPDRLLVALAETHDRYFDPGTGYRYSNTNYQLAVMVLEAVTGRSFAALLRERLVERLGLERTTVAPADGASPELRGYVPGRRYGQFVDVTDDFIAFGNGGNGGVMTTAAELLTIMQAIVSGRLLPADLIAEMTWMTPQSDSTYGLGLAKYELSCGAFYGHEGRVNGTSSIAVTGSDGNRGAVIALNLISELDPGLPALADDLLCR